MFLDSNNNCCSKEALTFRANDQPLMRGHCLVLVRLLASLPERFSSNSSLSAHGTYHVEDHAWTLAPMQAFHLLSLQSSHAAHTTHVRSESPTVRFVLCRGPDRV